MINKLIKQGICRHMISKDMQKSKVTNMHFTRRMDVLQATINSLESSHLDKFDDHAKISKGIDSRVTDTISRILELKDDTKRMVQYNSDKISQLKVHAGEVDKFQDITKRKIEEIIQRVKDTNIDSKERDEAIERRVNSKHDKFKDITDQRFDKLRDGKSI